MIEREKLRTEEGKIENGEITESRSKEIQEGDICSHSLEKLTPIKAGNIPDSDPVSKEKVNTINPFTTLSKISSPKISNPNPHLRSNIPLQKDAIDLPAANSPSQAIHCPSNLTSLNFKKALGKNLWEFPDQINSVSNGNPVEVASHKTAPLHPSPPQIEKPFATSFTDIPTLSLTQPFYQSLTMKWEKSIILKTFPTFQSSENLKTRLLKFWKIKGSFDLKYLGHNFYLVHNLLEEDCLKVLTARPWKLGKFPLLLKSWTPNFSAEEKSAERITTIWVQLHFLPIELQTPIVLCEIRNLLGKTIAVQVQNGENAHQVRFCIEMNLDFNLSNQIKINNRVYQLTFENLHTFGLLHPPPLMLFG